MSMEQFFTRQKASAGKKVPLQLPDGTRTEFYLIIRSRWSDEFRKAKEAAMRAAAAKVAAEGKNVDADALASSAAIDMIAALVVDWNLPETFTPENVRKLLQEAPQLAEKIDKLAADDKYFFKDGSLS